MKTRHSFIVLLTSLMFAVGVPLLVSGAQTERDEDDLPPGEIWIRGDGLGYNVFLYLGRNGRYVARWTGCLGEYGRSQGTWSEKERDVVLNPSREEGMMQGHLRRLERVTLSGEERLVPPNDIEDARRFDVGEPLKSFYAFKLSRLIENVPASDKAMEPTR